MSSASSHLSASSATDNWLEKLARAGYSTKGAVYLIIGALAVQAAIGSGGGTEGTKGAISSLSDEPFGQVMLVIMAIGLLCYGIWRVIEAVTDPRQLGTDAKALLKRGAYLLSGLLYLGLAWWAASIVFGWGGGSSGSDGSSKTEWTARVMEQPFGRWLVGIAGAVIIGVAIYRLVAAYQAKFMKHYNAATMTEKERNAALYTGQFGIAARAVTFVIIGVFLIRAALQADPQETKGLEGALDTLASQPLGPWILGIVALGLMAYGVYCFTRARYAHFPSTS